RLVERTSPRDRDRLGLPEREPRVANEAPLRARRGPDEVDVDAAFRELPPHGERWEHVPGRSAAGDRHLHRDALLLPVAACFAVSFGRLPFDVPFPAADPDSARPMFTRMPIAASETTSEEPPNDISGSGTPVTGRRPVTAPRFTTTWSPSHDTIPPARRRPNVSGALAAIRMPE